MTMEQQITTTRHAHTGLPGYMRASLHTASVGGANGYEQAGYTLGRHLDGELPWSAEIDEWDEELHAVDEFNDEQLAVWLSVTFPRIWSSVPSDRRARFVAGVRRGRTED
jgi:hypothetical protein